MPQFNRTPPAPAEQTGTCAWFDYDRGYGFIRLDCPQGHPAGLQPTCNVCGARLDDVFVHFSSLPGVPGQRSLRQAQRVKLEVVDGPKGPMAHNVELTK